MWSLAIISALALQATGHVISQLETRAEGSFSYVGNTGAINWYALNKTANRACAFGTHQSPAVIDSAVATIPASQVGGSVPNYPNGAVIRNIGTTVQVTVGGTLTYAGKTYTVEQYHFHTPSEHHLDGIAAAAEVHLVTRNQQDPTKLAVLAFLITICTEANCTDPILSATFASINSLVNPGSSATTGPLDFTTLFGRLANSQIRTYPGSLTTPPCSEVVTWLINTTRLRISNDLFNAVQRATKFNARYEQNRVGQTNLLQLAAQSFATP